MPAWSRPGTHKLGSPSMRCQRIIRSSRVTKSAWPLCSPPVTFGGGMVMTKGGRLPKFGCDSGRKRSCLTQKSAERDHVRAPRERLEHVAAALHATVDDDFGPPVDHFGDFGQRVEAAQTMVDLAAAMVGHPDVVDPMLHGDLGVLGGLHAFEHER